MFSIPVFCLLLFCRRCARFAVQALFPDGLSSRLDVPPLRRLELAEQ